MQRSSGSGFFTERLPSQTMLSKLFSHVESPQVRPWARCLCHSLSLGPCLARGKMHSLIPLVEPPMHV